MILSYEIVEAILYNNFPMHLINSDIFLIGLFIILLIVGEVIVIKLLNKKQEEGCGEPTTMFDFILANFLMLAISWIALLLMVLIATYWLDTIRIIGAIGILYFIKLSLFKLFIKKPEGEDDDNYGDEKCN